MLADHSLTDFALWLVPSSSTKPKLDALLVQLSKVSPESPAFTPHVTLFHPIPLSTPVPDIERDLTGIIRTVSSISGPLELSLQPAQSGKSYYQSVLAPVTPIQPLLDLREAVVVHYGGAAAVKSSYFPHVSLKYGDFAQERRDAIAQQVNEDKGVPDTITVEEISIVSCVGTADEWKIMGRVALAG